MILLSTVRDSGVHSWQSWRSGRFVHRVGSGAGPQGRGVRGGETAREAVWGKTRGECQSETFPRLPGPGPQPLPHPILVSQSWVQV